MAFKQIKEKIVIKCWNFNLKSIKYSVAKIKEI